MSAGSSSSPVRPGSARARSSPALSTASPIWSWRHRRRRGRAGPARRTASSTTSSPTSSSPAVGADEFLEHVTYAGNRYGTLRSEVERRLSNGQSVVLEIEVVGAREIKRQVPERSPSSLLRPAWRSSNGVWRDGTPTPPEVIRDRLRIASGEMNAQSMFDHVIVNAQLEEAAARAGRPSSGPRLQPGSST